MNDALLQYDVDKKTLSYEMFAIEYCGRICTKIRSSERTSIKLSECALPVIIIFDGPKFTASLLIKWPRSNCYILITPMKILV